MDLGRLVASTFLAGSIYFSGCAKIGCGQDAEYSWKSPHRGQAANLVESIEEKVRAKLNKGGLSYSFQSGWEVAQFYKTDISPLVQQLESMYNDLPEKDKQPFLDFLRQKHWFIFNEKFTDSHEHIFRLTLQSKIKDKYPITFEDYETLVASERDILEIRSIASYYLGKPRLRDDRFENLLVMTIASCDPNLVLTRSGAPHQVYFHIGKNNNDDNVWLNWSFGENYRPDYDFYHTVKKGIWRVGIALAEEGFKPN